MGEQTHEGSRGTRHAPRTTLFLIGYRGSGKTTVAELLAKRLGWQWLDADPLLEARAGRSIREIFADEGEAGFRDKESLLLDELCALRQHVIATGGGVILRPGNRGKLKAAGFVVWLTTEPRILWERINRDATTGQRRPNLTVGGLAEIEELLRQREPFYRECANLVVDTTGRTPEQIVDQILSGMS
jgi:shikimate kinase